MNSAFRAVGLVGAIPHFALGRVVVQAFERDGIAQ